MAAIGPLVACCLAEASVLVMSVGRTDKWGAGALITVALAGLEAAGICYLTVAVLFGIPAAP
jgi:hypothetical protein